MWRWLTYRGHVHLLGTTGMQLSNSQCNLHELHSLWLARVFFFFLLKIKICARLTAHMLSFFCTVGKSLFKTEIINISIASTWSCSTRSSFNLFIKDSGKWLGSHTIKANTIVFPKYFAFDTKWKYGEQRLWRMGQLCKTPGLLSSSL